jgi:RNA polymerase sigma-70 factor (ECF subfamily)
MKAFDDFYKARTPELLAWARKLCADQTLAEDLVAEAFERATEHALVHGRMPERAWFYTVVRNLATDHFRARRHLNVGGEEALPPAGSWADPVRQVEREHSAAAVRECLDGLKEASRALLVLREFEGKSYQEIADAQNLSMDQVKVGLFRARHELRESYRRKHGLQEK